MGVLALVYRGLLAFMCLVFGGILIWCLQIHGFGLRRVVCVGFMLFGVAVIWI